MNRTFVFYAFVACLGVVLTTVFIMIGRPDLIFIAGLVMYFLPVAAHRLIVEYESVQLLRSVHPRCRCREEMFYSYRTNGYTCEGCGQYVYWRDVLRSGGINIPDGVSSLGDMIYHNVVTERQVDRYEQRRQDKPDV